MSAFVDQFMQSSSDELSMERKTVYDSESDGVLVGVDVWPVGTKVVDDVAGRMRARRYLERDGSGVVKVGEVFRQEDTKPSERSEDTCSERTYQTIRDAPDNIWMELRVETRLPNGARKAFTRLLDESKLTGEILEDTIIEAEQPMVESRDGLAKQLYMPSVCSETLRTLVRAEDAMVILILGLSHL